MADTIALVTNQLAVGGAEQYVVSVANALVARGHRVHLVASPGALGALLDPRVRYHPVHLTDVRWGLSRAVLAVRRVLRSVRPRVVLTNSAVSTVVTRLAWRGALVVAVAHGWEAPTYRRVVWLLRMAHHVVAVSTDVGDRLVAAGLPRRRCTVVLNGIDLAPFLSGPVSSEARQELRADAGVAVIAVGRLEAPKAHQDLIAAAALLRDQGASVQISVAGPGSRREELQALIDAAQLTDRVWLLGSRDDVPALLRAADVYVTTSVREGMSLATIEAMAAGLPVVSTATEGTSELLDPACARVVGIGDVEAIARALGELAADPELRRELGQAGRARAVARFSHERVVDDLLAVFDSVARGR